VNPSRTLVRAGAVLASAALLVPATATTAGATGAARSDTVLMTVNSVSPSTPKPTKAATPLTVVLTLRNTSGTDLTGVRIIGERGDPIGNQDALNSAIADATPPASPGLPIPSQTPLIVDLPAGESVTATFATTTSTQDDGKGICLCHQAIYPLFFSAHQVGAGGVDQLLGVAATYLPVFYAKPAPVQVSWIWPLLERPHRLAGDTVFTDDLLAASVGPDGRLSRALEVVEQVGPTVPLTLLIDPELLDELEVMASGPYTVASPTGGKSTPGTGQAVASEWLDRLRTVLTTDPDVQVELTPYADPDVESLTARGLSWTSGVPSAMSAHVSDVLAGRAIDSTLAWPVAGAISRRTLATLAKTGVGTVVLKSTAVTPRPANGAVPRGLARLQAGYDIAAALTSRAVERYVANAITLGGLGIRVLPQLVAELAVRAAQEPDVEHDVTITPPRYVEPDVAAAVQTITETSTSTFSQPVSLQSAVKGSLLPTGTSQLARVPVSATTPVPVTLDAATNAVAGLPVIASLLDQKDDAAAKALVDNLPIAIQRAESSAWRDASGSTAAVYAAQLNDQITGITSGVRIINPPSGVYTLASNSSPLPITVDNELPYPVTIRIRVTTVPEGLAGFTTRDIGTQRVDSNQKRTLNVPTTTERSGRIRISAELLTPSGASLGAPVGLTVRSTALGVIGVVITVVAGVVLALALLFRLIRRLRARRPPQKPPVEPVPLDEPEPAS
jgi:hypothetical protein